jgi:hypothetical protein
MARFMDKNEQVQRNQRFQHRQDDFQKGHVI